MSQDTPLVVEAERGAQWRTLLGASAGLWSKRGDHEVGPGWWKAMSGARSVDFNLLVCHGADPDQVRKSLDAVGATKNPAVITLAGPGLSNAQILIDAGWVCIGARPIMMLDDIAGRHFSADPEVTVAGPDDLPCVWAAVSEAFGLTPEMAGVAIPANVFESPGQTVWKLTVDGDVRSCVAMVEIERSVMAWSMATLPVWQRQGYGRRLITAALAHSAGQGIATSLLHASYAGEPMYRAVGYEVVEYWQHWSRPRWVFGLS